MDQKKIKPLGDKILVKREEPKTTKGGILLPESAQQKPKMGKVVAVGPGIVNSKGLVSAPEVKVGDQVLFSSYGGNEYKWDGDDILILSENDILAIVK